MPIKRSRNFAIPQLSQKDETLPEGYISLYELFILSPKVKEIYGEKTAQELRKKTYKNILKLFNEYGSQDFARFWNYHVYEITDMGLNEFAKFEKLKDLCFYVECHGKEVMLKGKKRALISFGINQQKLEKFLKEKERCLHEGIEFIPRNFQKIKHNNFDADIIDFGGRVIKYTDDGKIFSLSDNAIFKRYQHWRLLKGYKVKEAISIALRDVVDSDPVEGTYSLEKYHVETIFNKKYLVREPVSNEIKQFKVNFPWEVFREAQEILARYNRDIDNMAYEDKTMTDYIVDGLRLINKQMPLKYSDPDKYAAYLKYKSEKERDGGSDE